METRKIPPPAARKATKTEQVADPLREAPRAVFDALRSLVGEAEMEVNEPMLPARGLAAPVPDVGEPLAVERAFAFIDVCGFTAYCDQHGEAAAVEVLARFRSITRHVVGQRGVRVAKWLGDGVMLVGTEAAPLVAAAVELVSRFRATGVDTHVGVASGDVLLFEGDDYIGRAVNLAARLCEAAAPGEVLAAAPLGELPGWIEQRGTVTVHVGGIGKVGGVARLAARSDVEALLSGTTSAA